MIFQLIFAHFKAFLPIVGWGEEVLLYQEEEHEATYPKIICYNGPKSNNSTHLVEPFVCVTIWLKLPNTFLLPSTFLSSIIESQINQAFPCRKLLK